MATIMQRKWLIMAIVTHRLPGQSPLLSTYKWIDENFILDDKGLKVMSGELVSEGNGNYISVTIAACTKLDITRIKPNDNL